MQNNKRKLYKEELSLWKEATKHDKKIKEYQSSFELKNKKEISNKKSINKKNNDEKNCNVESKKHILRKDNNLQINNRMRKNLERGKFRPEAILDLHGYNKLDARLTIFNFIKKNIDLNNRCVLVITGKKRSYFGAKSILRENLPKWLEEENISGMILSHSFAAVKDGGDGARYILLRKKEKVLNEKDS